MQVGAGLCLPEGIRVYDGSSDNPGTTQQQVDRCAAACFHKGTALAQGPWISRGDAVGFGLQSTGRCYCQHEAFATCKKAHFSYAAYEFVKCQAPAPWINTSFPASSLVTQFEYQQRGGNAKNKGVTLTFSDGSTQSFTLLNNDDLQSFALVPAVRTKSVRLSVNSQHHHVEKPNHGVVMGAGADQQGSGAATITFSGFCGITEGNCVLSTLRHAPRRTPHTSRQKWYGRSCQVVVQNALRMPVSADMMCGSGDVQHAALS